jgi:hypothetical protein
MVAAITDWMQLKTSLCDQEILLKHKYKYAAKVEE